MSRSRDLANRTITDDAVTLAKMAAGTDGNLITYDASGNPAFVTTGNDGQVLTSTGTGSPPAFEAIPAGSYSSNQPYFVSDFTDTAEDSGSVSVNTSYGFGTVIGPIAVPDDVKIRMHISGGMINYGTSGSSINYGTTVNHKTTSTFSGSTDGTFESVNWCNQTGSITSVYTLADYKNESGSSVNVYFRAGLKSSASQSDCRWYSASGSGSIRKFYELIQI